MGNSFSRLLDSSWPLFPDVSRTCNLATRAFIQYTYIFLPHATQTFVFSPSWHTALFLRPSLLCSN